MRNAIFLLKSFLVPQRRLQQELDGFFKINPGNFSLRIMPFDLVGLQHFYEGLASHA